MDIEKDRPDLVREQETRAPAGDRRPEVDSYFGQSQSSRISDSGTTACLAKHNDF